MKLLGLFLWRCLLCTSVLILGGALAICTGAGVIFFLERPDVLLSLKPWFYLLFGSALIVAGTSMIPFRD